MVNLTGQTPGKQFTGVSDRFRGSVREGKTGCRIAKGFAGRAGLAVWAAAGFDVHAVAAITVLAHIAAEFVDALLVTRDGGSSGIADDGLLVGVGKAWSCCLGRGFGTRTGAAAGWGCEFQWGLEFLGKDEVAADLRADGEGACTGYGEAVAVVEGFSAVVVVVGAEQETLRAEGAGFFDGRAQ